MKGEKEKDICRLFQRRKSEKKKKKRINIYMQQKRGKDIQSNGYSIFLKRKRNRRKGGKQVSFECRLAK